MDRGPEGLQVLSFVRNLTWSFPKNVLALIGPLAWDSGHGAFAEKDQAIGPQIGRMAMAVGWESFRLVHAASCRQKISRKSRLVLPRRFGPARWCCYSDGCAGARFYLFIYSPRCSVTSARTLLHFIYDRVGS